MARRGSSARCPEVGSGAPSPPDQGRPTLHLSVNPRRDPSGRRPVVDDVSPLPHPVHRFRYGRVAVAVRRPSPPATVGGRQVPGRGASPTPGCRIGDSATEENVETLGTRLRGESRRIRFGQIPEDGPHLSGARIEQNRRGEVGVTVQRRRPSRPGEGDAGQVSGPLGLRRENESEGRASVAVGDLRHGEVEGEELVAVRRSGR